MPITRTPMIDDDGSGTTGTIINNAWKQEFYNQIDATLAGYADLTLTDASGAGLGALGTGKYSRIDRIVFLWLSVVYPSTANGLTASIGGLPLQAVAQSGLYIAYGTPLVYHISGGASAITPRNATTLAGMTNAEMSGLNVVLAGHYLAP